MVQREILKVLELKLPKDKEVSIPAGWELVTVLASHEGALEEIGALIAEDLELK